MLILDMTSGCFIEPNVDPQDRQAAEIHQPEWNPVQTGLQSVQLTNAEPWKPAPGVINAGLEWLQRN